MSEIIKETMLGVLIGVIFASIIVYLSLQIKI